MALCTLGHLYALNADGSLKWKYEAGDRIAGSSPAVGGDGTVYVGSDDYYLYALNADGSLKWKYLTGGRIESSPAVGNDGTVYIGSHDYYLYALNADGSLKWRYQQGRFLYSSPAVGSDGTVYIGSDDNYLYALNADGSLKWKHQTGGYIYSSPAVGSDGTVYVGSADKYLHALNADGSLKWKYQTGDRIDSSPAVGSDSTVYIGSRDHYLYALNADSSLKWKYQTGNVIAFSSPAVGGDGTVYTGSGDHYLYALNADGSLKWKYQTGNVIAFSSVALGGDGTVYIGSEDSIGLSAGHVASSLHLAQRSLARNESALWQLQRLCNFSSVIHFVPSCRPSRGCNVCSACCKDYIPEDECSACFKEMCPPPTDSFTPETAQLVNISWQALRNYNASTPYLSAWEGFVDPLSFTYYTGLISTTGTMMTLPKAYETQLVAFKKAEATIDDRIAAAQDAVRGYDADQANWQAHLQRDTTAMSAYGKEITALNQEMDAKYATLQGSVLSLIQSLNGQLAVLKRKFEAAKSADEARHWWSIFSPFIQIVKAAVSVISCFGSAAATGGAALVECGTQSIAAVGSAIGSVSSCVQTFRSSCEPCKQLAAQMEEARAAEEEIDALAGMAKAARALNDQLSKGESLPDELPVLTSDKISMDSLRTAADSFKQELIKQAGSQGQQLISAIDDCTDMAITRVQLFLSYYNLASRLQNDAGSLKALQARTSIVHDRLKDEQRKEAAVVAAALLMHERQQEQAMLVTKYLFEEYKQYRYFSLSPSPPIVLPDDPTSTDILLLQQSLEEKYSAEIKAQEQRSLGTIYIEVNADAEPHTLASMRNGSASVVLPIPLKQLTDPATNASRMVADTLYYQMRLHDVGVYLLDASGALLGDGPVQVALTKAGLSSFFDSNMAMHVFSHGTVAYGSGIIIYDSTTGCARSQSYCGDLCPDYIRYSPYCKWNVQVYSPSEQHVDLSNLASIRFEFEVEYQMQPGFSPNLFGKDPKRYPQNVGQLCKREEQRETLKVNGSREWKYQKGGLIGSSSAEGGDGTLCVGTQDN